MLESRLAPLDLARRDRNQSDARASRKVADLRAPLYVFGVAGFGVEVRDDCVPRARLVVDVCADVIAVGRQQKDRHRLPRGECEGASLLLRAPLLLLLLALLRALLDGFEKLP